MPLITGMRNHEESWNEKLSELSVLWCLRPSTDLYTIEPRPNLQESNKLARWLNGLGGQGT
jgi:hypothetical protein